MRLVLTLNLSCRTSLWCCTSTRFSRHNNINYFTLFLHNSTSAILRKRVTSFYVCMLLLYLFPEFNSQLKGFFWRSDTAPLCVRPPAGEVTQSNNEQTLLNATGYFDELQPKGDEFLLALVLMQLSSLRNLTRVCLHVVVHGVEERERERGE